MARKGEAFRRMDDLSRVVIPVEMRRRYGIKAGDPVDFEERADGILVKPVTEGVCPVCGNKRCA